MESLGRGLWASVALHVLLAAFLIISPALFPVLGDVPWGSEAGGGGGISVRLVASESGVPLPAPLLTNPDAVGNDSTGFYTPPEATEPPAVPDEELADAEPIPETFAEVDELSEPEEPPAPREPAPPEPEPPPAPRASEPAPERSPRVPDNAVPFGEGGRPDVGAGISTRQGTGGVEFGDGTFGQQYGRYVDAMRRRISENWYQSMVDANVRPGLRVTLGFQVLRNGAIRNVRIIESSGVASLDTSAERAMLRVRQLEPLPATFRGTSIDVEFWFEFSR